MKYKAYSFQGCRIHMLYDGKCTSKNAAVHRMLLSYFWILSIVLKSARHGPNIRDTNSNQN